MLNLLKVLGRSHGSTNARSDAIFGMEKQTRAIEGGSFRGSRYQALVLEPGLEPATCAGRSHARAQVRIRAKAKASKANDSLAQMLVQ